MTPGQDTGAGARLPSRGADDRRPVYTGPMASARVTPHNLDAEASILGGIFLRNEVLSQLDTLEVEDFYSPKHQAVFQAMRNLEATAKPIDPVTVVAELERVGKAEAVGGLGFLSELT